jgi:hypothetical protein
MLKEHQNSRAAPKGSCDTERVLQPFRTGEAQKEKLLAAAREAPPSSPHLMTVTDGSLGTPPKGFVHDLSRSEIGRGLHVFGAAREAFQRWEQFDLGWVQVVNPAAKIAPGKLVAVETRRLPMVD